MRTKLSVFFFCAFAAAGFAADKHVVLVSVDGLRPELYLHPEVHGVELPAFRRLMREGVYAEAVEGVYPSVTYPSHTTIVTGVLPERHGILNNYVFDESGRFEDWYWNAEDIRAPTLWNVAEGTTAAVQWPVTVGAAIDYNFPEFWIPGSERTWRDVQTDVVTPALLASVEVELGRLPDRPLDEESLEDFVFRVGELLLEHHRPTLLLLHVINTDTKQHRYGREHEEVAQAFERVDRWLDRLREKIAALELAGETLLVVTGDHGFIQTHTWIHWNVLFRDAGLLEVDSNGAVTSYRAIAWPSGGSSAVMLRDPNDQATRQEVETFVDRILAGPIGGIVTKVSREELDRLEAMPGALFALEAAEGYIFGKNLEGELLTPSNALGFHGFLPHRPEMHTGFLMVGPGVRSGVRLPIVRQIDIAPTIASWAGWDLPGVEGLVLRGLFEEETR